jgi:uncharacterized membrane protein YbhN (UPF0104 family)
VVLLCLVGLSQFPALRGVVVLAVGLMLGVYVAIARSRRHAVQAAEVQFGGSRLKHVLARVQGLLASARPCHTPVLLLTTTALSLAAWAAEAWAFYLLLGALGSNASLSFSVFVYAIAVLAGALSFLPGGLGGTEATMMSLLLLTGHAQPVAVVATVLIRLSTLWFAVALGLVALLRLMREPAAAPATSAGASPGESPGTSLGAPSGATLRAPSGSSPGSAMAAATGQAGAALPATVEPLGASR